MTGPSCARCRRPLPPHVEVEAPGFELVCVLCSYERGEALDLVGADDQIEVLELEFEEVLARPDYRPPSIVEIASEPCRPGCGVPGPLTRQLGRRAPVCAPCLARELLARVDRASDKARARARAFLEDRGGRS